MVNFVFWGHVRVCWWAFVVCLRFVGFSAVFFEVLDMIVVDCVWLRFGACVLFFIVLVMWFCFHGGG